MYVYIFSVAIFNCKDKQKIIFENKARVVGKNVYHQCSSLIHPPDAVPTKISRMGEDIIKCNLT